MSDRAWKTMAVFDDYEDEIKRLRSENERLNKALDDIADTLMGNLTRGSCRDLAVAVDDVLAGLRDEATDE